MAPTAHASAAAVQPTALIATTDAGGGALDAAGCLSLGLLSAGEGDYTRTQMLLDVTQGARIAGPRYGTRLTAAPALVPLGNGGVIAGWAQVRRRAAAAPGVLVPGLLAGSVPGGGAFLGAGAADTLDAVLAADRSGRVARLSPGSAASLPRRLALALASSRLVVTALPPGAAGVALLGGLCSARRAGELLLVLQRSGGRPLRWLGIAGLAGPRGELTSDSTRERGLVSTVDLAPTVLAHLHLAVPGQMQGRAIRARGALDEPALARLLGRLQAIEGRRLPALAVLLGVWAAICAVAAIAGGSVRERTVRAGALGVLWAPAVALIPAAIAPSAAAEYAIVTVGCLLAGALSDSLLRWPRALIAPAVVTVAALALDALLEGQLLARSLLGPDPAGGARFYGIGNELKSGLAVLVLAAAAAALHPARRSRRAAGAVAVSGALLALLEGAARIGAGVGGVVLVAAGFALAAALLLPGGLDRRRAVAVVLAPLAGLLLLAAVDLATAHGSGHFSGSVLHARSAGELRDLLARHYETAWEALRSWPMALATLAAVAAALAGVRRRERIAAGDPGFLAAFAGGLLAGVVGALVEDSGPLLLVVAVFTMACAALYLHYGPSQPDHAPAASAAGS